MTALDEAWFAMDAAPENTDARRRFYDRLVATRLHVLLVAEAIGDQIEPKLISVEQDRFALAFDTEDRLAAFAATAACFATLSGRDLVSMLACEGIGLALNLEAAPSAMLLPVPAVRWIAERLTGAPMVSAAAPVSVGPPRSVPEPMLSAIDAALGRAQGLATCAWLVGVSYASGAHGNLLAIVDAPEPAERAIAQALNDAIALSGTSAVGLDIVFLPGDAPRLGPITRHGIRFDIPVRLRGSAPKQRAAKPRQGPGRDPERPPKLR